MKLKTKKLMALTLNEPTLPMIKSIEVKLFPFS
jgi:hypothetical protein